MEFERERILNGQSVCILAFAEEWAEQECNKLRESGDGLAHWAYPGKLEGMLAELRHAVSSNVLKVYDFGRERDYRETDKAKVEKGHIHVLPRSANAWLEREGFASLALCNDDVCEASNATVGNSASFPATVTQLDPTPDSLPAPACEPATPEHDGSIAAIALSPEQDRKRRRDKLPSDEVEKRAELLRMFRLFDGKRPNEKGKKGKWGAMADLERETGIDSKNLGPMLDKAIEEKRAADMWAQLNKSR